MIEINGKQFDYKKHKKGVLLFNNAEPFAFVVNNKHNEQFIVSVSSSNGAIRYMFSTSSLDDKLLGLDKISYSAGIELAKSIINQVYH